MWQNLRDSYRRKLKTRLEKKSGDCAKKDDNWPYFEAMDFLRNVLTPRESSGNITSIHFENIGDIDSLENFTDYEDNGNVGNISNVAGPSSLGASLENDPSDEVLENPQTSKNGNKKPNKPSEKRANKRGYNDNEKFLEIESKKLQILAERFATKPEKKDDADTHFVLSLLEPLKELSSLHKMKVKSEIMNLLTRALENKDEQTPSARFIVSPALSVNTNYSATPPLSGSIGSLDECSSGVDNFTPSVVIGNFPTNSQNQYHHHTTNNAGIYRRL